ncbi:hypothetical protein [Nostoc phage A1]|nr:hypothetical protein [Nostoc phage A1]
MTAINSENREAWQVLATTLSNQNPGVGKNVKIVDGRKHKGKTGKVIKHQRDRYSDAFRYGDSATHHLREIKGRYGYVCLIKDDTGSTFWVKAEYTEVVEKEN